ncbi:MAG: bifunctional diaminohydroxyphosphoribosylaminopyrimidine deaminase/5-amino-6-(5-phosphoribosylamino)uracil reductase RibD [Bacteroidia bacterium]
MQRKVDLSFNKHIILLLNYIWAMEVFMRRALELARRGLGSVAPNPMVGCVIVHNNEIIGEGWHRQYGEAHAEVNAINSVNDKDILSKSTLYVTLEPCSHFGKTPPCADLILKYKIPKVVIASIDPNPLVAGRGISKLRDAGLEVIEGVLQDESNFLNRRFITFHEKKRPYVILKWAQSADGFIDSVRQDDSKGSFAISSTSSHQLSHKYRTEEQAILIGKSTALNDLPQLTSRLWPGKNPLRILIDPMLEVPSHNPVLNTDSRTLVFNKLETRQIFNVDRIQLDFSKPVLNNILDYLYYEGIQSVIVEGGKFTLERFIKAELFDEIRRFTSLKLKIKNGLKAPEISLSAVESQVIAKADLLEIFRKD